MFERIRHQTELGLKKVYPGKKVSVRISSRKRDFEEQAKHYDSGASKTPISLHNLDLAADYTIFIDGKQVTANGSDTLQGSTEPYRVLGHYAKENGLFWGWEWDSGHVGETRFVAEVFEKFPELAKEKHVKKFYDNIIKKKSLPLSMKGVIETLGSIYGRSYKGSFTGNPEELEKLLEPLNPDKK